MSGAAPGLEDSVFLPEQMGEQRRRFLALFLCHQRSQPFASLGMRRVDFKKLGIDRACASGELQTLEQFGERDIDRLSPRIKIDCFLELFDGLISVLGYCPEAARQHGAVQSL